MSMYLRVNSDYVIVGRQSGRMYGAQDEDFTLYHDSAKNRKLIKARYDEAGRQYRNRWDWNDGIDPNPLTFPDCPVADGDTFLHCNAHDIF